MTFCACIRELFSAKEIEYECLNSTSAKNAVTAVTPGMEMTESKTKKGVNMLSYIDQNVKLIQLKFVIRQVSKWVLISIDIKCVASFQK